MHIELTVADHVKNGFISLAAWPAGSEQEARDAIASVDALVDDDAEPDSDTCDFAFILDLHETADGMNCIDNGRRILPLQIAMRLAPEQVSAWLSARPEPEDLVGCRPPVLAGLPA